MCCISVYITIKLAWHAEQYTSAICCIVRLITQKNLKMLEFFFPPQMKYNFLLKRALDHNCTANISSGITVETGTPVKRVHFTSICHTHYNVEVYMLQ